MSKVDLNGPIPANAPELGQCHLWTRGVDRNGYGKFAITGKSYQAHRVAWFITTGAWPLKHCCHRCDRPGCVNQSHMFDGDQRSNMRDCLAKGRHVSQRTDIVRTHVRAFGGKQGQYPRVLKLDKHKRVELVALYAAGQHTRSQVAKLFGVGRTMVGSIVRQASRRSSD